MNNFHSLVCREKLGWADIFCDVTRLAELFCPGLKTVDYFCEMLGFVTDEQLEKLINGMRNEKLENFLIAGSHRHRKVCEEHRGSLLRFREV